MHFYPIFQHFFYEQKGVQMICDVTESVIIINIGNHFKYLFDICELAFVLGLNVLNSDIWNPYVTIVYQLIPFTFFQILICQQPVVHSF